MSAGFTPAPWLAAAKPSSVAGWPVVGELGTVIADVSTLSFPGQRIPGEAHANAHLIAAAPDLYEAGYAFLEAYADGASDEALAPLGIKLGRALVKARGEVA